MAKTLTSHTPGPWRVEEPLEDFQEFIVNAGPFRLSHDNITIDNITVEVCRVNRQGDQTRANARMVAAAPDLFEALEEYLDAGHKEARRKASIKAKKAIAKALFGLPR